MEKGRFGIRYGWYAAAVFACALFGQALAGLLILGFVLLCEKDEWLHRQCLTGVCLIFLSFVTSVLRELAAGLQSLVYQSITPFDFFGTQSSFTINPLAGLLGGIALLLMLAIYVLSILGMVRVIKGREADIPVASRIACWAMDFKRSKKEDDFDIVGNVFEDDDPDQGSGDNK